MTEEWRPIPGWDGYEASNLGRVRSLLNTRGRPLDVPKMLAQSVRHEPGKAPRPYVQLWRNGRRSRQQTACYVLMAFVGPREPGMEASHIDGDPMNNDIDNLVWETHQRNMARKLEHGTVLRGDLHQNTKLSERDVHLAKRMLERGISGSVIAAVFEVSHPTIIKVRNGERR